PSPQPPRSAPLLQPPCSQPPSSKTAPVQSPRLQYLSFFVS
ncbi:unnamed protein product, partial [Musa acuminata var. zebrina]